jgi:hypothetical protein
VKPLISSPTDGSLLFNDNFSTAMFIYSLFECIVMELRGKKIGSYGWLSWLGWTTVAVCCERCSGPSGSM